MFSVRYLCAASCTTLFLVILATPSSAPADDPALARLLQVSFNTLEKLEKSLEGRRWQDAVAHLQEFQSQTTVMAREAGEVVDKNFLYHIGYSSGRLDLSLRNRDRNRCEDYYRDLYDLYLRLANRLTEGEPLTLAVIIKHIHEADHWNGQSNFREIVFELKEISRYFRNVYPMLEAKGVDHPEIWAFHGEVNQAMAAAEVGNAEVTASSLDRLETLAEGFRSLFAETGVRKATIRP